MLQFVIDTLAQAQDRTMSQSALYLAIGGYTGNRSGSATAIKGLLKKRVIEIREENDGDNITTSYKLVKLS